MDEDAPPPQENFSDTDSDTDIDDFSDQDLDDIHDNDLGIEIPDLFHEGTAANHAKTLALEFGQRINERIAHEQSQERDNPPPQNISDRALFNLLFETGQRCTASDGTLALAGAGDILARIISYQAGEAGNEDPLRSARLVDQSFHCNAMYSLWSLVANPSDIAIKNRVRLKAAETVTPHILPWIVAGMKRKHGTNNSALHPEAEEIDDVKDDFMGSSRRHIALLTLWNMSQSREVLPVLAKFGILDYIPRMIENRSADQQVYYPDDHRFYCALILSNFGQLEDGTLSKSQVSLHNYNIAAELRASLIEGMSGKMYAGALWHNPRNRNQTALDGLLLSVCCLATTEENQMNLAGIRDRDLLSITLPSGSILNEGLLPKSSIFPVLLSIMVRPRDFSDATIFRSCEAIRTLVHLPCPKMNLQRYLLKSNSLQEYGSHFLDFGADGRAIIASNPKISRLALLEHLVNLCDGAKYGDVNPVVLHDMKITLESIWGVAQLSDLARGTILGCMGSDRLEMLRKDNDIQNRNYQFQIPTTNELLHLIEAHAAGMFQDPTSHRWFWYGESKKTSDLADHGVNCYSSASIAGPWTFVGQVIAQKDLPEKINGQEGPFIVERPKVLYNTKTKKYVCWYRHSAVFQSDSPTGPFEFVHALQPDGIPSLDMSLFQDPIDGQAYLIRSCNNEYAGISRLSADYLNTTGLISSHSKFEGMALFRHPNG
eukprot:UC4_evm3s7